MAVVTNTSGIGTKYAVVGVPPNAISRAHESSSSAEPRPYKIGTYESGPDNSLFGGSSLEEPRYNSANPFGNEETALQPPPDVGPQWTRRCAAIALGALTLCACYKVYEIYNAGEGGEDPQTTPSPILDPTGNSTSLVASTTIQAATTLASIVTKTTQALATTLTTTLEPTTRTPAQMGIDQRLTELLGVRHFIRGSAWNKLNVRVQEPPLTQEILDAVKDMKSKGMMPHLVLDAGLSMAKLDGKLPYSGDGSVKFRNFREREKRASWATSSRPPQWLLIDKSDQGILLGSRYKTRSERQAYLAKNYPDFREASVGEYASLAIITAVETGEKLLPSSPLTYATT